MATLMQDIFPACPDPSDLLAAATGLAALSADRISLHDRLSVTRFLERYLHDLRRVSELADQLGYRGLRRACRTVRATAEALRVRDDGLSPQSLKALDTWAELVRWHLELPSEAWATEVLVHHLRLPHWVSPLDQADAQVLMTLLMEERRNSGPDEG